MHAGQDRTLGRLRLDWFWPGMTSDVRRLLQTCGTCQAAKHSRKTKPTAKQHLYAGRPWQFLSVDLVGPFSKTARGNTTIIVVADHFTRWRDALPAPDGTAQTVAQILDERIFCYFGLPEQLYSDQGAQFESRLMQELCAIWGVVKTRTTPYHPQGNGLVERGNRDLGDALRSLLLNSDEREWDLLLPQIMRGIRASPHKSTGVTSNELMFGRELLLPDQLVYGRKVARPETREAYAIKLQDRLQKAHEALRQQQTEIRNADYCEPPAFREGEYVLMINKRQKKGQTAKLAPKYVGPYKVIQVFPNRTYLISRDGQSSIENETRLKLFIGPEDPRAEAPVTLEPNRRKTMIGRPPAVKTITPTVLQQLRDVDEQVRQLADNQKKQAELRRPADPIPPAADFNQHPADFQLAPTPLVNLIPPDADPPTDQPPENSYRDALLHDHSYFQLSRTTTQPPPVEPPSNSSVIVTPLPRKKTSQKSTGNQSIKLPIQIVKQT